MSDVKNLEIKIRELQTELEQERAERAELVDKLEQCVKFAAGLKQQRDEAIKVTEQLIKAAEKHEKKIVLPGHLDNKGNSKIIT